MEAREPRSTTAGGACVGSRNSGTLAGVDALGLVATQPDAIPAPAAVSRVDFSTPERGAGCPSLAANLLEKGLHGRKVAERCIVIGRWRTVS